MESSGGHRSCQPACHRSVGLPLAPARLTICGRPAPWTARSTGPGDADRHVPGRLGRLVQQGSDELDEGDGSMNLELQPSPRGPVSFRSGNPFDRPEVVDVGKHQCASHRQLSAREGVPLYVGYCWEAAMTLVTYGDHPCTWDVVPVGEPRHESHP